MLQRPSLASNISHRPEGPSSPTPPQFNSKNAVKYCILQLKFVTCSWVASPACHPVLSMIRRRRFRQVNLTPTATVKYPSSFFYDRGVLPVNTGGIFADLSRFWPILAISVIFGPSFFDFYHFSDSAIRLTSKLKPTLYYCSSQKGFKAGQLVTSRWRKNSLTWGFSRAAPSSKTALFLHACFSW